MPVTTKAGRIDFHAQRHTYASCRGGVRRGDGTVADALTFGGPVRPGLREEREASREGRRSPAVVWVCVWSRTLTLPDSSDSTGQRQTVCPAPAVPKHRQIDEKPMIS